MAKTVAPKTMVYGTYNYNYWGESKPTNITGGPHIVVLFYSLQLWPFISYTSLVIFMG